MFFTWVHFAAEKPPHDSSNTTPSRVFSSGNEILVAKLRIKDQNFGKRCGASEQSFVVPVPWKAIGLQWEG